MPSWQKFKRWYVLGLFSVLIVGIAWAADLPFVFYNSSGQYQAHVDATGHFHGRGWQNRHSSETTRWLTAAGTHKISINDAGQVIFLDSGMQYGVTAMPAAGGTRLVSATFDTAMADLNYEVILTTVGVTFNATAPPAAGSQNVTGAFPLMVYDKQLGGFNISNIAGHNNNVSATWMVFRTAE